MSTRRVRELPPAPTPPSFGELIEQQARRTLEQRKAQLWRPDASAVIERQMALVLDQLDLERALHQQCRRELLQQECAIDTQAMQLDRLRPRVMPDDPDRHRLQEQLRRVEQERRQLRLRHHQQVSLLQERLLGLWHQHRQLNP